MADTTLTDRVAGFASGLGYDDIPYDAREKYKFLVLDSLACGIGGIGIDPGRESASLMEGMGSPGRATVWATGAEIAGALAAYANASLANALDFDDTYSGAGHPGSTVVPVVFALAEEAGSSGRDVMAAVAAGYELTVRLGLALRPSPRRHRQAFGYGHQTLAAAAAGANLLGFPTERTASALGLAAVHSPVPSARRLNLRPADRPLSWLKNNYGWMAMGAALSLELASRGFAGPKNVLDGDDGYGTMLGSDRFEPSHLTDDLGTDFVSAETEVKPYAACRWTHSAMEAAHLVRQRLGLPESKEIASVEVEWFGGDDLFNVPEPADAIDAQFSLPFLVALALTGILPTGPIADSTLADPEVRALSHKVAVATDPALEEVFDSGRGRPARVTVETTGGERLSENVETPLGHPPRLLGWPEVKQKAETLVDPVLGKGAARRLIELCGELEALDGMATFWKDVVSASS